MVGCYGVSSVAKVLQNCYCCDNVALSAIVIGINYLVEILVSYTKVEASEASRNFCVAN